MFERWLMMQPALLAQLLTLAGHDLACWCAPLPCCGGQTAWNARGGDPVDRSGCAACY
jgi:hypothetical protein